MRRGLPWMASVIFIEQTMGKPMSEQPPSIDAGTRSFRSLVLR